MNCKLGRREGGEYKYAGMWYESYDELVLHRSLTPYHRWRGFGRRFKPLSEEYWQRPRSRMVVTTKFGEYTL